MDSVPPETPIRDVVDRCRVWESHADPEIRRVSKPGPEPIYPAYMVGDSDKVMEEIQVAEVTKPKSTPEQVEDLFRRLLAGVATPAPVPAPIPDVPVVEKLLQHLVAETQIRQPAPVPILRDPAGLGGGGAGRAGGPPPGSVVRFDPGGGVAWIAVPREAVDMEMRSYSVSSVMKPQSVPSRISVVLVEETEVRGADCLASVPVDRAVRLLAGAACPASVTVCEDCVMMPGAVGTLSPSDSDSVRHVGPGGTLSSSDLAGILFPVVPAGILVGPVGPVGTLSAECFGFFND